MTSMKSFVKHAALLVAGVSLVSFTFATVAHAGGGWKKKTKVYGDPGEPLPGLTDFEMQLFEDGLDLFDRDITINEGLGPLHNGPACSTCHAAPAVGGSDPAGTDNNALHYGVFDQERFLPVAIIGGPVAQETSIAGSPEVPGCTMLPDFPVPLPGLITSSRHTPPVFGFGLLDAVKDKTIIKWQGRKWWKHPSVIGMAHYGVEMEGIAQARQIFLVPRTRPTGPPRVGRFGWKAQTGTLFQFSAEPFNVELGVTSPWFGTENTPDGQAVPPECQAADSEPNDPQSQKSLQLYHFQALTAAPKRGHIGWKEVVGELVFYSAGCADCHRKTMKTAKNYYMTLQDGTPHRVAALSNKIIQPWSDLLIHDMGDELDDKRQMGLASGKFWRTTPLWGLRHKTRFLHDGRADNLHDAIVAHGGEGAWSRDRYEALPNAAKNLLYDFLESL